MIERKKEFIKQIIKSCGPDDCYREIVEKTGDDIDTIIKALLESKDKKIISSQAYAVASRLNLDGQHWNRLREMMGNKCRKTESDAGGLKVGNDEFSIIIPNGYGDGVTRYAVLEEDDITIDISDAMDYFTSINGKFNIYDYDCGNNILEVIEGTFAVYRYEGIIIFEKY